MKTKIVQWLIPVGLMVSTGCEDNQEMKDQGKAAATEFCDCYKKHSWDVCFAELSANYKDHKHYAFVEAFDDANTCGVTHLELKAREAAAEYCECREEKSEDDCNTQLNAHYGSYITEEFAGILTEVNECEHEFIIIRKSASATRRTSERVNE
ncbi:hypothetical protein FACS189430_08390 [Bacteroidia bacterium]|nr:hypothetical protein FACS189430_08390 [Bacteroidia bacterium]